MRERDVAENVASQMPEDEELKEAALWVAELYTASSASQLRQGLERLYAETPNAFFGNDVLSWLDVQDASPISRGFRNTGALINHKHHDKAWPGVNFAPLPDFASLATGALYSLPSGLTIWVMGFTLGEAHREMIERMLKEWHDTQLTFTRTGARITNPAHQKERHIREYRTGLVRDAGKWFSDIAPGFFSRTCRPGLFPACELLITKKDAPFTKAWGGEHPTPRSLESYLYCADIRPSLDLWKGTEKYNSGLYLSRDTYNLERRNTLVLGGTIDGIAPEVDLSAWGGRRLEGLAHYVGEVASPLVMQWCVWVATGTGNEAVLASRRNLRESASAPWWNPFAASGPLRRLQKSLDGVMEVSSVARGASLATAPEAHFAELGGPSFTSLTRLGDMNKPEDFLSGLEESTHLRAERVEAAAQSLTDAIRADSDISAAVSNLRLQVGAAVIAVVLLVLAFASLYFASAQYQLTRTRDVTTHTRDVGS